MIAWQSTKNGQMKMYKTTFALALEAEKYKLQYPILLGFFNSL